MTASMASEVQQDEALRAFDMADPRLERLRQIIAEQSYQEGEFLLSSGRTSTYFFQLRQTTMHAEGASLIGALVVDFMHRSGLHCVGGLEMGAVPVVCAAAVMAFQSGYPLDAFFVRKAAKAHGARELIDGHVRPGAEILMVDDVTTTGGSTLRAVAALAGMDCTVTKALSVVDREEGAAANFAAHGITLYCLFRRSDFKTA